MNTRIYRPGKATVSDPPTDSSPGGSGGQVSPFPLQCLPTAAADMATGICQTERVPDSLAGCCVLGILSASVGAGLEVKSGPDRLTRGNLYLLASAESGSGKSETFRHAGKPFLDFERQQIELWKANALPGLQAEKDLLEAEIGHLKKDAGKTKNQGTVEREEIRQELEKKKAALLIVEAQLQPPVLSVEDITTEKLAVLLSRRAECLASLSADAGNIINNVLGRYNKLERTDEGVYLKAFSGDYCRVDRIGREPVVLSRPCLSALWLVQPDKIATLLSERALTEGGLMPRFLICDTNCQPRPIIDGVLPIPLRVVNAYGQLIHDLIQACRLAPKPITVEPTQEALRAMNDHHNGIVTRRNGELRDVTSFAARWNEHAWRIAVVLHAALWPAGAAGHPLELETAQRAITLADWFAEQQLGILAAGRAVARRALQDLVLELLADKPAGITARDVQRARIRDKADEALQLLKSFEADGILDGHDIKPQSGGHVTRIFQKAR